MSETNTGRVTKDGFIVQVRTETWPDGSKIVKVWHDEQPLREVTIHLDPAADDPNKRVMVNWPSGNTTIAHAMAFGAVLSVASGLAARLFREHVTRATV